MESQGSLGHLGSLAGGPVDYRQIRDLLKVQRNAPTDAANTPPPPITSQGHIFRQPPGRRRPYHPDVWGSVEHPYNASPEGMATLLKTGGMPINPDGEYGQEVSDPPEPPVVMRRTRFFASIRTALLELREHVDGCVAEYVEQPGEDTGVGELTSKLSGLTQEEQAELAAEEAERKERLRAGIESAFENALGDLGKIVYQVFQYAGAKHVALERLRDNLGQREEVIVERMHQDAAEAEQRLDEEADKLEEAQEKFDQAREEWRKLLLMAHSRGCAERELQRDVVALKRGMRQLLEDADAASSKHQMVLSAEREKRRDELAMLQQTVHDAKMDAAKARESLCVTKSELKEANGKLEDFRLLVAGQDKQLEKQRERLSEMHKLEAQLREFFSMQGSKGLDAWHKGLRGLVGATVHDDELTNGAYGLGKGIVELMGQQKLLQAQRWVRGIFPETWPVFRPARKHLEIPPPDMSSQGSPSPETSMATPSAARHPGTARNSNPVLGVLCFPPGLRRMVAAARQGGGATMSLRDTNVSIAEVFWAWLQADPQMREWGLLGFAHLWFLQRESGVVAAEDRLVMLMSCAAAQGMGMSASPRCRAFARLTGVLDGGLPPKGCTEACLEAWGALVSPNGGGGPSHENEAGLIYVNQDRIKPAVEATDANPDLQKTMMSKIKAVVCPETNRRSRIHGMLCADEVLGVLLEEWSRDFAGAVETRIRRLAVTHDRRVDGMLELSDFAAVVEGAWDPEAKGGAELSPGSLARMYSAVAEACHASGAQPGKITHDCLLEAARFFGWGATQSSSPSQHKGVPKVTAFPALWEAVGAQLEFMLAGLKGLKASGSSAAVDTAPAEVLMGRCKEAAAAGAGKDAQWDAFKSLVASIAEAATNAFRRLPAHQPTEESSSKGKAKDKKKVSNAAGTLSSQQQPEEPPAKESSFDLRSGVSDPELLRKLELMKETVEQQLDMANENVRELEHKLALAEARAKAAEATANGGQRANTDSEAAARELVLRLEATEAQLAAEVQRAAKAEHRTAKRFDHLDGASMASAAILDKLESLQGAAQRLRLDHQALQAEAAHHRQILSSSTREAAEAITAAVQASWKGLRHDSGRELALELSQEASGYLASPRPSAGRVPAPVPAFSVAGSSRPVSATAVPPAVHGGGVPTGSWFARRVEEDLRSYELEVKLMRFDSRVDGLEELVEDTLTPHDAQLIRRHPERGPDGLGGVEKELEDEEDDALLEEVSQGRLGAAAAGEKHWDQRYGGDEERLELQAVSDLLAEASRESSAPDLARTESRTNQLLAELSEDSFLRKGAQIPGVEQAVWEGMGGTRSGLPPPPRGIGVGPYAHRQARRSDGAESAASDWDERGFEPMRKTTEADLVAEGAALLHERSGEAVARGGSLLLPEIASPEMLMTQMDAVREAAKIVDSEAVELEHKVEMVRAANQALQSRAAELDARAERLRVASDMLQRQVVSLRSKSALVRRERDALQAEHVRLRSNRDRLVAVAEKVKSRKFNLRAAEAIYVRKWHKLEGISRGLVGLEGALSVCSSDMHAMAELLVERASALGMEMSPVVLPPPKAVRMHIGVEALAIGKQGRPSASRRPASASPLCGAGSSPTSRTAPSRPGSAKHQHKRPGSAVGCSGSVTRHPYQTIASTAGPHSSCTASFSSGPYSPGPGPVCVSGPISEDSATPPGTLSGGIGDGVVGRPLSATNNLPQQRQNSNAAGLPPPPSVAAFSASSPGWLREGGEVRDAPLELHAPLRQLYALSARLEQVAASLAVYTDDVLGGSRVSLESYEEASPRDFLEAIAHPGATAEDPTIMAALVADVIQSRINRASAQTYKGQRQTASLPSYRSAAHRIHAGGSSTSGANFEHDYSGFGDVEYPAAPGPTHGGPFAAAKPRPPMGMIPTSAVQRGQDLESLCRTLAERHAEQLRRERRRQEPQPAHRRRPSRPLPPSYLPGTDIQMPAGPVLGGRAVPRELLPKSADVGAGVNRRSTDMLTAVARGVERQAASASVGNRDALNRRHGNALNIKSGSARSVGSRLNRSAANMSPPKERENTSPPPMQVSKMIPSQSPPRQKR